MITKMMLSLIRTGQILKVDYFINLFESTNA